MMHLPTTKQLKGFLKDNKKTVWLTALATLLLYALGIGYTLFSNGAVEEEQEMFLYCILREYLESLT